MNRFTRSIVDFVRREEFEELNIQTEDHSSNAIANFLGWIFHYVVVPSSLLISAVVIALLICIVITLRRWKVNRDMAWTCVLIFFRYCILRNCTRSESGASTDTSRTGIRKPAREDGNATDLDSNWIELQPLASQNPISLVAG